MKIHQARTGIALEKKLYLRAQKRGEEFGQSFAAYVIDLIAKDLAANCPDAAKIPDVMRIISMQMNADKRSGEEPNQENRRAS